MTVLERIDDYIMKNRWKAYTYKVKKLGVDAFKRYIIENNLNIEETEFTRENLDEFILVWLPKNKKYLSDEEGYQAICTINDLFCQMKQETETSIILDIYADEYRRIYKVRNLLLSLTKDPVIGVDPIVIDLSKYRQQKKQSFHNDLMTNYEQATFEVEECKDGGVVLLNKLGYNKTYKMLLEYPIYKYLKKGDILQACIKRKFFSVYWEFEEVKAYYLPQAKNLIK